MQEQSIFIEALEKDDPDQRAAFLDRVCGDDAALRQRIDKLLQRHQQADDFLERPAADLGVTVDQPPLSERPSPMIGPYKLLQPIGEGGMGVVWMAEQEQPVRRKVALKIIKPGMDSRQVIVRFEAERQALALMDHHNIARVFDADATESGRPHMARSPANLTILAGSLERVKLADTALRILQEGQHAYPADFCLNYQLGFLLYRRKDYAGAIRYCSVAVALRPDNAWAHRQLGAYLHGQGKFAEAEASYREAIRLEPDWAKPHDDLAWLLATCCDPKFRNYQQAVESAKRAVQLAPHEFSFWNTLGVAYRNGGKLDEAVAPFREAIRLKPDWPHAPYNLGIALRNRGKIAEAKATLREAIRLAPDWDLPHNDLAWLLATCDNPTFRNYPQAIDLAKRAVELTPTEGNYWNTLGAAHYRAGDWKAAAQTLKKSMELRKGGDCVDWFFLAMAHWQLGEKEQARQWYDKAVQWMDKNDPKNDELRRFRSEAAELLGVEKKNKSSRFGEREGRCVVAATRKPHRRGKAPVFGLSGRMMAMPSVF